MPDDLDEKLGRVSRRLEARRSEIRSRLEAAPELAACLDALKATFGARLRFVRIGDWTQGTDVPEGVIVRAEVQAKPPRRQRRPHR